MTDTFDKMHKLLNHLFFFLIVVRQLLVDKHFAALLYAFGARGEGIGFSHLYDWNVHCNNYISFYDFYGEIKRFVLGLVSM